TRRAAALRSCASVLLTRLALDESLTKIYHDVELPVMQVLTKMERLGVLLDVEKLKGQSAELGERIESLMEKIYEIAGEKFNPASPKQLAQILFEKLGLPVKKKTASGTPSTDEEVLSELALDYPLPKLILEYRSLAKLKSTYTDKLPQMVDPKDGRVHTTFGQATAVTGRLASSEPNLQNIPVRTPEGRRIREAFVAPAGYQIVSADYSQIELRIMAHISGDAGLIDAFMHGKDIHRATAAEVFGVDLDQVTPDQRRMAKVINFGLIYGMSAFGLAQNLGVARGVASSYIEQYFARYPKVQTYMTNTRALAHAQGFVETAFGRRLWLPDIQSSRAPVRAAAERAAINAPMQGTAADLIKLAMVAVQNWLEEKGLKSRMILQVHDELILEVPADEIELVKAKLPELMAGVAKLSVPLIAEVGVADNWEAAH
ncbi:MAG: DNA polymerase I, partial [Sutterellaceae bacterium]|nr:DNA polymerase I [Sutterellaceae bacterium]